MRRRVLITIAVLVFAFFQTGYAKDSNLEVHFINVGQGDSILVKTPDSKTILIDAGIHATSQDDYNPFLYLAEHNIKKLDVIFITHPHDDHYKGFSYLCSKKGKKDIHIGAVYYSVEPGDPYGRFNKCLEEIIKESDESDQVYARGPPLKVGAVAFKIIYPREPIEKVSVNKNEDSIVMKMIYKNVSFLFTGDADTKVEDRILTQDLISTVLKVGHHGSSTSTGDDFLAKVDPKYAVISSNDEDGKGKTYAHPHAPTLKKLKARKVKLYRTDLSGTIVMTSNGENISVKTANEVSQDDSKLWKPGRKGN